MGATYRGGTKIFADRQQAGQELAAWFLRSRPDGDLVVLGLPRGGVPVAFEVAQALGAPLDVFLVRKIGAPFNPELAAGAVASGRIAVYNADVLNAFGLREQDLAEARAREEVELVRRERVYRQGPALPLRGRRVIVVDDGVATGATMRAAIAALRSAEPAAVIAAAPTASREAVATLEDVADTVAVLEVPEPYIAVGAWYARFPQLTDDEVVRLLRQARAGPGAAQSPAAGGQAPQ